MDQPRCWLEVLTKRGWWPVMEGMGQYSISKSTCSGSTSPLIQQPIIQVAACSLKKSRCSSLYPSLSEPFSTKLSSSAIMFAMMGRISGSVAKVISPRSRRTVQEGSSAGRVGS